MMPPAALNAMRRMPTLLASRRCFSPFALPSSSSSSSSSTPSRPACATALGPRAFSTTRPAQVKTIKPHRLPADLIPPYPYGERRVYKQANRGLYGSARIRFGNTVAEKHNNKSPRFWRPNVHVKIFYSPSFGANVKTRLTIRVLKTIRSEGGIDNYLLKSKPARIKELGPGGWNLRWLLMQTKAVQQRFNEERVALGLEPKEIEDRDDIIHYALDYATPGPLNARSRVIFDKMRAEAAEAFVLGDESLADVEGAQELSDEAEGALLQQVDAEDMATKNAKEGKLAPEV